jgi:Na+-translocating ferredoxin:NAD+ oxidoreductase RnfC subunit
MPVKKEDRVVITLKVDTSSYDRLVAKGQVKRGDLLGFSPYFDGHVVLSPIDGTIERITYDREERALIVSIRLTDRQRQAAHP